MLFVFLLGLFFRNARRDGVWILLIAKELVRVGRHVHLALVVPAAQALWLHMTKDLRERHFDHPFLFEARIRRENANRRLPVKAG